MEIQKFIEKFAEVLDTEEVLTPDTIYADLDEWSSMAVVQLIVMIDEEFEKNISANQIRKCSTIQDLYCVITNSK